MRTLDDKDSGIFIRGNLTDFEKLLFANKEIENLKYELKKTRIEKGKLHSEIEFLKSLYNKNLLIKYTALLRINKELKLKLISKT